MNDSVPLWFDDEAGPLVRLYAMTGGRAGASGRFDLMTVVRAVPLPGHGPPLPPEQRELHLLCARPRTVADLASDAGLPLGVVRVLLDDLLTSGLIGVGPQVQPAGLPDPHLLRRVIDGLRAL
ncbi:DUF742 domain-containing protein [Streptomyces sp. YC504]|uniref:DUF742 domain-containing protein n=1 Tax=Streptomyces mesophilus TaxID=1775132 RepID=A0A6G4XB14_9ACTN|nr:DUF742 domain-containing protein [Streptomyces mesophilus]NGO74578.1 DUF742 domain-containing protein [Streptomyces mesophilus]